MLTDKMGRPIPQAGGDDGNEMITYITAPEAGLSGPPIEHFRLVAKPEGWELRVTHPSAKAKIKRSDLPDLLKTIIVMMLRDQQKMLALHFDEMRAQNPIPEREPQA